MALWGSRPIMHDVDEGQTFVSMRRSETVLFRIYYLFPLL